MPWPGKKQKQPVPKDGYPGDSATAIGDQQSRPENESMRQWLNRKTGSLFSRGRLQQQPSASSSQASFASPPGPQVQSSASQPGTEYIGHLIQAVHRSDGAPTPSKSTTISADTQSKGNSPQLGPIAPPLCTSGDHSQSPNLNRTLSQQDSDSPQGFQDAIPHYSAASRSPEVSISPAAPDDQTDSTSNTEPVLRTAEITQEEVMENQFKLVWEATLQIANIELTKNKLPTLDPQSFLATSAEENIQSVITQLEAAKADNQKQQWRYKWRGQEVIVVERWGTLLRVVEKYSKIVDTAIQHSPEVSSLVWASAKTILQVALNHVDTIEMLEATMTTIVEKIARCEFYASIYLGVEMSTSNDNLHKALNLALPHLYAAVVVFAIKAQDYYSSRWPKNIGKMLMPYDVEIKPFVDEIKARESAMRACADGGTMERIRGMEGKMQEILSGVVLLNDMAAAVNEHRKETADIATRFFEHHKEGMELKRQEDERTHELLKILSPLEPLKRHQDIKATRLPDTGMWLLRHACFRDWSNTGGHGKSRLLCCYGIPGAGKTVMSSLVIDDLNSRYAHCPGIGIACIYSDYRDQTSQTVVHIVGSILHQLLNCTVFAQVPHEVIKTLEDIKKRNTKVGLDDILEIPYHISSARSSA